MNKFNGIEYRGHNGYDQKAASDEAANAGPTGEQISLTVQAMAEENDLNVLMARYGLTGKMPENPKVPMYGDFTDVRDYRTALERIRAADQGFMELPAAVRARFENNPQKLLEFCDSNANRPEAEKLGLLRPVPPPAAPPPAAAQKAKGTT